MSIFTTETIKAAKNDASENGKDVWKTEGGNRGEGRLRLRASPHGVISYFFRYSLSGKQYQLRLDIDGRTDLTLAEARDRARDYTSLYRKGITDLHQHAALEAKAAQAKLAAEAATLDVMKRAEEARAKQGTFAQLLDAYTTDLDRRGKSSAKDVRGAFRIDVLDAFPALAAKPAKEIEEEDISEILRHCRTRPVASKGRGKRLTPASATNGKLRQAAKLRAYLQAAFGFGKGIDLNSQREKEAVRFGLKNRPNPVRDVPTIEGANRAETWALDKTELRHVLLAVEALPERHRAIAKTMLYAAGQRVEMLTRVTWADFHDDDEHGPVMQMLDPKGGKGTPPRIHLLPMTERLAEVMAPLQGTGAPGPFSLRGDRTATPGTLQKIFSDLGDTLSAAGKTRRFTWRHMRATCETHLASLGVNQERRAWLLSHGRSGVQAKHYDRYSYLPEKRADLEKWSRYLDQLVSGEAAKVVQLHA
jgi:integrase